MNTYDGNGNVIELSTSVDATLTKEGSPADAKSVGDKFTELVGISIVEPADNDVPRVFFNGALPTTKDQGKVKLKVEYHSRTKSIVEWCTLKVQGDSSASYPKKNFNMAMFHDEALTEKDKHNFRGWGRTSKFCLKANWIDHLHARNVVNAKLYGQMCRTRADWLNYPERFRESPNCACVDGFPVMVYANGVYQGLYTWNIAKDDFMSNMDDESETDCMLIADRPYAPGVLFSGPSVIDTNKTDWTDELHDEAPQWVHDSWEAAQTFVRNSSDVDFAAGIEQYFYLSSLIDRYIFNLVFTYIGGYAKSQAYYTYDGVKWMSSMYDLDTAWSLNTYGTGWHATDLPMADYTWDNDHVRANNVLLDKVARVFPAQIKSRYAELRAGVLTAGNILWQFEHFIDPIEGRLAEDYAATTAGGAFVDIPSKDTNTVQKLRQVVVERLAYSDSFINTL